MLRITQTLLLWGSLEAIFGGLAWQSYRNPKSVMALILGST